MDCPNRNSLAAGLPDEDILARAPFSFSSVCRSKCVAKARSNLIDDSLNRGRLPKTMEPLDIDACLCFPFPMKLPETEGLRAVDSCNGLVLLERYPYPKSKQHYLKSSVFEVLSYIVCDPATKHWVTVPVCASCPPSKGLFLSDIFLAFDPAVSSHFHLVHFWKWGWVEGAPWTIKEILMSPLSVHTYSSETGVWSHSQTDWNEQGHLEGWRHQFSIGYGLDLRAFVNGILHLRVIKDKDCSDQIVAVDVQGRTKRTIKMPAAAQGRCWYSNPYIGQSQGRLHYINRDLDAHSSSRVQGYELFIWVLQDYDTQEWALKDTVSFLRLFGRMTVGLRDFHILAIHPDRNVVWFRQHSNGLVREYDMDSKEVSVVGKISENVPRFVPYFPYSSESRALTNKN